MNSYGQTFNEGISSGGFVAVINALNYVFDPFTITPETMVNKTKGPLGQTTAKQGILLDRTATATVQVPYDGSEDPIWLVEGDTFTDPDGLEWWVSEAPLERRSGDVRKQNIKCEQKLT